MNINCSLREFSNYLQLDAYKTLRGMRKFVSFATEARYMTNVFNYCYESNCDFNRSHPYSWMECSNHPVLNDSRWVRAHWCINANLVLAYSSFVACRTVQICLDDSEPLVNKLYMAFTCSVYALSATAVTTTVAMRHSFAPFLRRYISFLQDGESS